MARDRRPRPPTQAAREAMGPTQSLRAPPPAFTIPAERCAVSRHGACCCGGIVMKVLTVYAHHNPRSFCHAVLERFCDGLEDAGHSNEVVDLHAIGFDPVFRDADSPNWIDDSVPDDVLALMNLEKSLLDGASNSARRWLVRRWIGGLDARGIDEYSLRYPGVQSVEHVYFHAVHGVDDATRRGYLERAYELGRTFADSSSREGA
jgi:hypothetical protein